MQASAQEFRRVFILIGVIYHSLLIAPAPTAAQQNARVLSDNDITSESPLKRVQTARHLAYARDHIINTLVKIVEADVDKPQRQMNEPRELAIELLGEYRAAQAVELLVKHVSLQVDRYTEAVDPLRGFPCVEALVKIGTPSLRGLLKRMEHPAEVSERDLHLLAYIVRAVDGDEVGRFRLQQAINNAKDTNTSNLLRLMEIYKLNESEFDVRSAILSPKAPT